MDNEKLLIGGVVIIALVLAIPIVAPMLSKKNQYDAVADSHKIQQLLDAVDAYGQTNQHYPPSLHHLVPDYIDEIPLTSTNLQFEYNPQNGRVTNPSAPIVPDAKSQNALGNPGKRGRKGSSGVTPATDAITGIGVSQELNF
jgi:hypothetical protein